MLKRSLLGVVVAGFLACGESEADGQQPSGEAAPENEEVAAAGSGAPTVEESYQDDIDEAWAEAVAGEDPMVTCSMMKGSAAASEPGTATRALEACNVDIPVRYFLTDLDRVESGDQTCSNFMALMHRNLPAMTMSIEPVREMARELRGSEADSGEAAASVYSKDDAQRRIKDRLRERVTEVCPEVAGRF